MNKAIDLLTEQIMLTFRLMTDGRVPFWAKLLPLGALVYLISPIDILPDIIPVLTQLDDIGVILASFKLLEMFAPADVVVSHRAAIQRRRAGTVGAADDVVDAPNFRVAEEKPKRKNS
jgi:uncharacterized membrane protein YkvA (DUF1232 family)